MSRQRCVRRQAVAKDDLAEQYERMQLLLLAGWPTLGEEDARVSGFCLGLELSLLDDESTCFMNTEQVVSTEKKQMKNGPSSWVEKWCYIGMGLWNTILILGRIFSALARNILSVGDTNSNDFFLGIIENLKI